MEPDRDLVCHRARWHEECRLHVDDLGRELLESVDARIFAVHVIADFGPGDRVPHAGRRFRHGVAAQIDDAHVQKRASSPDRLQHAPAMQHRARQAAAALLLEKRLQLVEYSLGLVDLNVVAGFRDFSQLRVDEFVHDFDGAFVRE